jgi:hypothetical protein
MKFTVLAVLVVISSPLFAHIDPSCNPPLPIPQIELPPTPIDLPSVPSLDRFNRSGGWSGNGGDFGEVNDNIWFIGKKPIKYCIQSSEDYFSNRSELENLLETSLSKWHSFFLKYNLLGNLNSSKISHSRRHSTEFIDGLDRGANFKFEFSNTCKGSDLQFFFGITNQVIKDYKKFETEHPFGFAIRKSYDHENFANSGIIWIENLKSTKKIEHTLLHELGHIFGMKHDSVYIMRSTMAVEMEGNAITENEIEIKSWPYRFLDNSSLQLYPEMTNRRGQKNCKLAGSFQAGRAAQFYSSFTPVKANDCLILEIKSLGSTKKKGIIFEFTLENISTNLKTKAVGNFKSKRKVLGKSKGPGVFTQLATKTPRGNKLIWKKIFSDKKENYELSGSFKIKNKVIPAKLIQDKGATLDLYISYSDDWMTLKSSNY